jgi:agmatine deiminase
MEDDNIWIRDYAPIFLQDEQLNTIVFSFLYPHVAQADYNFFAEQFASKNQLPFIRSNVYSSGGGREINGKGTIILVEGYEKTINPNMSKEEIEHEYRVKFNQTNFVWLKRGLPMDDHFDNGPVFDNIYGNGVNWHIDEFCRFANAETILLAQVDSADLASGGLYKILWERLEESYEILKSSLDQDGKPFNIVRVPQAPIILKEADYHGSDIFFTPITSYLNFVLSSNTVVIPAYFRIGDLENIREKDNKAKKVFESVFTNKEVVMINCLDLNYLGGGLHCITATKPKTKKRRFSLPIFSKRSYG